MNWENKIISDKNILLGKPTIKGTRLSVEFIIERLASGWKQEQLQEKHPLCNSPICIYQFAIFTFGIDL